MAYRRSGRDDYYDEFDEFDDFAGEESGRQSGNGSYGRGRQRVYDSWEDEEDYEEFARARDKKYGNRRPAARGDRAQGPAARQGAQNRGGAQNSRPARAGSSAGDPRRGSGATGAGSDPRRGGSATGAGGRTSSPGPEKKKKKKKGFFGIILRLLLILVLLVVIVGGILAFRMRDMLRMQRVNSVDLEEQLQSGIAWQVRNDEIMKGYTNIALFGVDSRSGDLLDGDNRSDTIMIASINKETGEIRLVSVYRDTMLNVGDDYYTKANTAYALGGPERAINMLNLCFDMNIVDFVTVGFEGLAHTIDALGGIELEIDEEEREYLNMYVHDMSVELGTDDTPVEETGTVLVTGIQATAYSRIRYTAGDDFKRAERQRIVLEKTLQKAKQASPTTLVDVANNVMGDMATSLSSKELMSLILKAGSLELADTGGLPREEYRAFGENYEDGSFILPLTLEDNVKWLHEFLFDQEDYQLSDEASSVDTYLQNNFWPAY
ncbi:MAG: LCP family protein [Lachnospiraceae bacterium]|nr:LCP family protein [Lachnospiraceae bacterium]